MEWQRRSKVGRYRGIVSLSGAALRDEQRRLQLQLGHVPLRPTDTLRSLLSVSTLQRIFVRFMWIPTHDVGSQLRYQTSCYCWSGSWRGTVKSTAYWHSIILNSFSVKLHWFPTVLIGFWGLNAKGMNPQWNDDKLINEWQRTKFRINDSQIWYRKKLPREYK